MNDGLPHAHRLSVATDPYAAEPALRGRTYSIRFEDVWQAALWLAQGGMRGCATLRSDDRDGVIEASSTRRIFRRQDDLRIRVTLDENAQTRVDLDSSPTDGARGLGRNRRLVASFLTRLDRRLGAEPGRILDPTAPPTWRGDAP